VQYESFANGVENEDVVAVVGGTDAIVLVLVPLIIEPEIVRVVLGGFLEARCVGCGV
jgi:hypothetical protein